MPHPVDRALEDGHVCAEADGDHRGVVADDSAADHQHSAGGDSGHSAEQQTTAPERLLQEVRAGLGREPAGDLAHRREQRQRAVGCLDGLVRDAGRAARDQRFGQLLARGEMEVGEEDLALAQPRILLGKGLLHLEHQLGGGPDLVDRCHPRADRLEVPVGERASLPRPHLDQHFVPALHQFPGTGRGERHTVLVRLDLLDDADLHGRADSNGSGPGLLEVGARGEQGEARGRLGRVDRSREDHPDGHPQTVVERMIASPLQLGAADLEIRRMLVREVPEEERVSPSQRWRLRTSPAGGTS